MKRSPLFAAQRKADARRDGRDQATTYAFWFRRKYGLTPNDPLFLGLTPREIEAEYWAHHFFENPATESDEDSDFDTEALVAAMERDDWETVIDE